MTRADTPVKRQAHTEKTRRLRALGRATLAIAALALCVGWLLYYAVLATYMVQRLHMNDFGKFYYSARLFLDGQDMYGPSPATAIPVAGTETRQFLNMNPPHFHLVMLPLAELPPGVALSVWSVINLLALILSLRLISRELGISWTRGR